MSRPRLYLVDASIYVFRSWHVMPDTLVDADGEPINAVVGFADFLLRFLDDARPTHLAIAFDESLETSVRHDLYPAYKANRDPAPEELLRQFAHCRELVRAAGLAEFASRHYEADDVIATLAASMRHHGLATTVVTGDKDLTQLIEGDDEWWDFARNRRLDARGVERRFGVRPDQIADMLAIAGDRIDNIPGVPGIGVATAARLLKKWDNLENLYANLAGVNHMQIRGAARIARLLAEHRETVALSRRLTGTLTADGLPADPAALVPVAADEDRLDDCFDLLGFGAERRRRFARALAGNGREEARGAHA